MSHLQVVQGGQVMGMGIADYVWLDEDGDLEWKKKTILLAKDNKGQPVPLLERWTTSTDKEHVILVPCHYLPDPTRQQPHFLVLCEVRDLDDIPLKTERRALLRKLQASKGEWGRLTWFGFMQDYSLDTDDIKVKNLVGERHFGACYESGIYIHSMTDWPGANISDFKVGYRHFPHDIDQDPANALVVADHLFIARYLMHKVAAEHGTTVDWEGLTVYVTTPDLREPGANQQAISKDLMEKLYPFTHKGRDEEPEDLVSKVPDPVRGQVQCIRVVSDDSHPYTLAHDILDALGKHIIPTTPTVVSEPTGE